MLTLAGSIFVTACAADSGSPAARPYPQPETAPGTGAGGATSTGGATSVGGSTSAGGGLGQDTKCTFEGCHQTGNGSGGAAVGGAAGAAVGGAPGTPPAGTLGGPCMSTGCPSGAPCCTAMLVCSDTMVCQPEATALPPFIVQSVPPPNSVGVPPLSPIVFFVAPNTPTVTFTVEVFTPSGSEDITSEFSFAPPLENQAKAKIYVLAPKHQLPLGGTIIVRASAMGAQGTLVFTMASATTPSPASLDFDAPTAAKPKLPGAPDNPPSLRELPSGWVSYGDVAVQSGAPVTDAGVPVLPSSGSAYAGLSTSGDATGDPNLTPFGVFGGRAVRGASSLLESGPIELHPGGLSFDYVMQSSEIPDFCQNSTYDDSFLAIVSGPLGVRAALVDTVNAICVESAGVYPKVQMQGLVMPPAMYGRSKRSFEISTDVGSPGVIALVVTDVGDASYDTFVAVDSMSLLSE